MREAKVWGQSLKNSESQVPQPLKKAQITSVNSEESQMIHVLKGGPQAGHVATDGRDLAFMP